MNEQKPVEDFEPGTDCVNPQDRVDAPKPAHVEPDDEAQQAGPIPLEPLTPSGRVMPSARTPELDKPGLLDDFDEEADFEHDPEVEQAVRGIPVEDPPATEPSIWGTRGMLSGKPISPSTKWKFATGVGIVAAVTAAVFAGINHDSVVWAHVLLTLYLAILHTATGVGAVLVTALLLGRSVGRFDSAASRMLAAVGLYLLVYNINMPIPGHIEEMLLASAAYIGTIMVGFRIPVRDAAVIGSVHFGLWMLVWAGNALSTVIGAGSVAT